MPIDPERWTNNTKAAFSAATGHAASSNNPELTPAHLLDALLVQHETMTRPLLTQVGVDPDELADRVREQLDRLPRAQGGAEPGLSREARAVLEAADEIRRELGDDYVSVEHLLLALADEIGVTKDALLTALRAVRGNHRVTTADPEQTYQALAKYGRDLTEAARDGQARPGHRARRGDPAGHPGPVAAHQEQPGADRRARRGQDGHRRGAGQPDHRGRRARRAQGQAGHRARPGLHGGRGQVPGRVRGAAQGGPEGDHRRRGRGRHLHRRAAHHRRRRRGRGGHGRRADDQADAGPRRAAAHRRHHARRVPHLHREGRRAGAALPAGLRGRAVGRGHHRHPARAWPSATRCTTACASRMPRWCPPPSCRTATSPGASCPTRPST